METHLAKKNFRILSLDGGGTWALIQVCALKELFGGGAITGRDVLLQFDLVTANSGGSIVLGALLADMSLDDLLDFFSSKDKLDSIFVPVNFEDDAASYFLRHFLDQNIGAKYSAAGKLAGLEDALHPYGDVPMDGLHGLINAANYAGHQVNFVICAFDYDSQRETFFRSDTQSLAASGTGQVPATLAQAIHASSNAPVNYFDAPALVGCRRYWDGAIGGYNNPVFAGVMEAIANLQRYAIADARSIACLSIGSGTVALLPPGAPGNPDAAFVMKKTTSTIPHDVVKMAESILDDPPDAASFHAHVTLGGSLALAGGGCVTDGPVVRMSPLIQPIKGADGKWSPPGDLKAQFTSLVNLDFDAHEITDIALIQALCDSWIAGNSNNQPIRANAMTTAAEIGHGKFSQALAAWKALRDA
jgi:hypothetical protein